MLVTFWGTRGSIAKAGPSTLRYGGNTSCVSVQSISGTFIVLDCGTGAHGLGQYLMAIGNKRGHLLISHTHWDHIQGLPFFAPLFVPGNEWDIYAPKGLGDSLRETLAGQMQYTYFPITLEQLGATIRYHDLVEGSFAAGDLFVRAQYLNHPALALGYRIEGDGAAAVYACDHEPHDRVLASGKGPIGDQDRRHIAFLKNADLVIHDAQYTAIEYSNKIGWGHSSHEYARSVCVEAGAKRLAITHHDPLRDDDAIEQIVKTLRSSLVPSCELEIFAAAEGQTIELTGTGPSPVMVDSSALATPFLGTHSVLLGSENTKTNSLLARIASEDKLPLLHATSPASIPELLLTQPSVILLESGGELDALGIAKRIRERASEWSTNVPIIIIADRPDANAAEVTDWLLTPFSTEYARTRVRAWIMRSACRWMKAAAPRDEEDRLAALYQLSILDSAREERYDRITRLAAAAFDVPIALVSLVDKERQWFKSCIGLNVKETSRDAAFCAHAILTKDVFVVPDTLLDSRFADNPLVTGDPRIRFYAGCPLSLSDGYPLGTLCIIDSRPHELTDSKIALLKDLARLAEVELARTSA